MGLADVHAHLTHRRLAADVDAVLGRARDAGVTTIVSNGLNPADNRAVLALARRHAVVRPALGLYPVDAVLPDEPLWARQEDVFRAMVGLALEAGKPIIVHTRKRERRAFELLRELGATRVCWHCFGGKVSLARDIAAHGHWLSIPANARRSESFTRMLETLPRDRILLETDCPYLSPDRARASELADVAATAAYAAERWGVSEAEVVAQTAESFARLFGVAP
jgi:TatD DNase family protein